MAVSASRQRVSGNHRQCSRRNFAPFAPSIQQFGLLYYAEFRCGQAVRRNSTSSPNAAGTWPLIARFAAAESRLGELAARRRDTSVGYEFLRFRCKQAWACPFGGATVAPLVATHWW